MRVNLCLASFLVFTVAVLAGCAAAHSSYVEGSIREGVPSWFSTASLEANIRHPRLTEGEVRRPQWRDAWKKGMVKVSALKLDDVKVKVYGTTAIASVLDTETTTYGGKDVSGNTAARMSL